MDHQIFTMQDYGGISRVFVELFKRFNEKKDVECKLPIRFSENVYLEGVLSTKRILPNNKSFPKRLFYYGINHLITIIELLKGDYDVFLPSYYDPYFIYFLRGKPFVLVLHDMTHELFPNTASRKDKTVSWKRKLVDKADKIVAISENTKKDILKFYKVDESKIDVIYWATTLSLTSRKQKMNLPKKYIMYVGSRGKYKNYKFFFESIADLLQKDKELNLLCVGSGKFTEEESMEITKRNLDDQVKQIRFSDDNELAYIYKNALCLVYPSQYEGFGSPILEAFACDCPVILSNTSSLPEVGGNAVVTFNPKDSVSIKNTVEEVLTNEGLRKSLRKRGKERLKEFTYEKTINEYIKTFESVIY